MKIHYTIIFACSFVVGNLFAQQTVVPGYDKVTQELTDWDPVRGPWLANSLQAMSGNAHIPVRNFPEKYTPYQMLRMVPVDTRGRIQKHIRENQNSENTAFWSDIDRYISAPNCPVSTGRSYGDPHIVSYDGARYSFQTVGEFVMTKDTRNNMEVQVRQSAQSDEFSLNTAVAMNVGGDRVCIYAEGYPDGDYSTPLRIDGNPLNMNGSTYQLAHGGTIRKNGDEYLVNWPTGEVVVAKIRRQRSMNFMEVNVSVQDCARTFTGILGNANGNSRDDFGSGTVSPPISSTRAGDYWQRERQAFIAKQFADMHRVTMANTLFDYFPGHTTETYTDRSYPRVYPRPDDFNQRKWERSRRYCEGQGINRLDMNGCIYDNMMLGLDASPEPTVPDPTQGTVLRPVTGETTNTNSVKPTGVYANPSDERVSPNQTVTAQGIAKPEGSTSQNDSSKDPVVTEPERNDPVRSNPPTSTPPPTPKPPVFAPKPQTPRTTPRPSTPPRSTPPPRVSTPRPKSTPTPVIKSGGGIIKR